MRDEIIFKQQKIIAGLYLGLGLGFGTLAAQVYLSGYYKAILLPTLLTPIFLALGLWRWQTASNFKNDPAAIVALLALSVFILLQPETLSDITQWHWVALCYPLLTFYLLPTSVSLVFSLLLLAGLLNLRLQNQPVEQMLAYTSHYLLLVLITWFYGAHSRIKTKRLEQLVGIDKICGFYNSQHLTQRLKAEVSRAKATHRPLALLLVELHQYPEIQQELSQALANKFIHEASKVCKYNWRIGDEAYRYDSQTLLLLMPNTTINGALVLRARLYQNLLQELACDLGPIDVSITPLELQIGEQVADLERRIANSCYHSLSDRVEDNLDS